jgi:hypothetical protein
MGEGRWQWMRQQPEEFVSRMVTGLVILAFGVGGVMIAPGPPPPEAALKHASGQAKRVEIDDGRRGPYGVAFELEDENGRRHRFYLQEFDDEIQSISDKLTYASRSIYEPEVVVGYEDGNPEEELSVFELTVAGERLARYSEVAEIRRVDAKFVPSFSMVSWWPDLHF